MNQKFYSHCKGHREDTYGPRPRVLFQGTERNLEKHMFLPKELQQVFMAGLGVPSHRGMGAGQPS